MIFTKEQTDFLKKAGFEVNEITLENDDGTTFEVADLDKSGMQISVFSKAVISISKNLLTIEPKKNGYSVIIHRTGDATMYCH